MTLSGAGGNRTLVRRTGTVRATTVPEAVAHGCHIAGSTGPEGPPLGLSRVSAVFHAVSWSLPAVLHRFCCQAAMDRPRVPLLVAISLVSPGPRIRRREQHARWRL